MKVRTASKFSSLTLLDSLGNRVFLWLMLWAIIHSAYFSLVSLSYFGQSTFFSFIFPHCVTKHGSFLEIQLRLVNLFGFAIGLFVKKLGFRPKYLPLDCWETPKKSRRSSKVPSAHSFIFSRTWSLSKASQQSRFIPFKAFFVSKIWARYSFNKLMSSFSTLSTILVRNPMCFPLQHLKNTWQYITRSCKQGGGLQGFTHFEHFFLL